MSSNQSLMPADVRMLKKLVDEAAYNVVMPTDTAGMLPVCDLSMLQAVQKELDGWLAAHPQRSYTMAFNKKHYEAIAEVLHSTMPGFNAAAGLTPPVSDKMVQWEGTCLAFLNHFRNDNPAFEADRFLRACKGEFPKRKA